MRKPLFKTLLCLSLLVPFTGNGQDKNALEAGFMNPAEKVQTSVYWYWISGNISEEGVKKDLYSMKEAGINRAFIGNIGLEGIHTPYKTVPFYSEEWWKILHAALKTATELGIEIGIFNSPGWSQSGGPWVKPEQAMRYLASVKAEVSGGKQVEVVLAKPDKDFQDVRVIAFPSVEKKATRLSAANAKVTSAMSLQNLNHLVDGNKETVFRKQITTFHRTWLEKTICDNDPQFRIPKIQKDLKDVQAMRYYEVEHIRTILGCEIYRNSFMGRTVEYCIRKDGLTYHDRNMERLASGLQYKIRRLKEQTVLPKGTDDSMEISAETVHRNMGYCLIGIEAFAEDYGLDVARTYTLKELKDVIHEHGYKPSLEKYKKEVQHLNLI